MALDSMEPSLTTKLVFSVADWWNKCCCSPDLWRGIGKGTVIGHYILGWVRSKLGQISDDSKSSRKNVVATSFEGDLSTS